MRKIIIPILLFMILMPFYVNAENCETEKIFINSINAVNKTKNVIELEEAKANGKELDLNISMSEVGDSITYKIEVKNDSNEDYELDKKSFNITSDYVDYSLDSKENSYTVKANSTKIVYLTIEYKNKVPNDVYESGKYNDNTNMVVQLSTGDTINVPNTLKNKTLELQYYIAIVLILFVLGITGYINVRKMKYSKYMILLIGALILIPISASAICKCELTINSKVTINKQTQVYSYFNQSVGETPSETVYESLDEALQAFDQDFIIRMNTVGDIVRSLDIVYLLDGEVQEVHGGDNTVSYEQQVADAKELYGEDNCDVDEYGFYCEKSGIRIRIGENGFVSIGAIGGYYCTIESNGIAFCGDD